jgi:hypothetical protein
LHLLFSRPCSQKPQPLRRLVTVISDNYLSATVVSYQKKGSGSHFVPFSLHVILSVFIYDRAEGRVCLPFSPLVFSPLFFQYPQPRRLIVTSHTRSSLGRAPGFALTPGIFVISGDFSFVLLCTYRAPGSSRPACFRLSEVAATSRFGHLSIGPSVLPLSA